MCNQEPKFYCLVKLVMYLKTHFLDYSPFVYELTERNKIYFPPDKFQKKVCKYTKCLSRSKNILLSLWLMYLVWCRNYDWQVKSTNHYLVCSIILTAHLFTDAIQITIKNITIKDYLDKDYNHIFSKYVSLFDFS